MPIVEKSTKQKWEEIALKINIDMGIDRKGMFFPGFYKGKVIAYVYCSGEIEFVNKSGWKKGWEFRTDFNDEGFKAIYKRNGKGV